MPRSGYRSSKTAVAKVAALREAVALSGGGGGGQMHAAQVGTVGGRTWLLPPRFREGAGVDGVKAGVFDKPPANLAVTFSVGEYGASDAPSAAGGPAIE